jgi:uncharacterized phage protein (TIGR02218 family)
MSRTVSGALAGHLATRAHKRCSMLRLDLVDGASIGITDHDQDLPFNLGDGSITYTASTGIFPSDVTLASGLEADSYEVTGPIGARVTLAAVLGGRYNRARARLFMVNWDDLTQGALAIMAGNVAEARPEGGKFVFEIRSDADKFNQTIGRLITPYCPGDHATCCVQIADELATTLSAVVDEFHITVAAAIDPADYTNGKLWFTSGVLNGALPVEIVGGSGSTLELFTPLAATPSNGDALTLKEGCDRTLAMCRDRFSNAINHRGFPFTPGSDQVLKVPVPGA